jgi:hypothetical protein
VTYTELSALIQQYTQNDETTFVAAIPTFVTQTEARVYNSVQIPPLRKNVTGAVSANNKYLSCPIDFLSSFSMAVINTDGSYEYLLNKDVNFMRAAYPSPTDTGVPKYYALFGPTVNSGVTTTELSFILAPTPDAAYNVELHYYYYPESIVQGVISSVGSLVGGSGYTNGVYYGTALTGGTGSGATATILVAGGVVTSVTLINGGVSYAVGDVLSASVPGGASFSTTVATVNNSTGTSWLGDNYSPVLLYGSLVEAYIFLKGEADMMAYYQKKYEEAMGQLNRLGTGLERGDAYRDGQAKIKVNP